MTKRSLLFRMLAPVAAHCLLSNAQVPLPNGAGIDAGTLPAKWINGGPDCTEVPDWQIHQYSPGFFIIRESGCTNYEKPFVFVVFGKEKVLLIDTGAGKNDIGRVFNELVAKWLKQNKQESIKRMVMHTHAHGDHIAGDAQFKDDPAVEFVAPDLPAIQKAFQFTQWPEGAAKVDLGGRGLDIIPIPGHHTTDLAIYDARSGLLLTGDSLYPGRLYVTNWPEYVKSINRLTRFTEGKVIAHILGNHVEQSATPYLDYPVGTVYQPNERALELGRAHLLELQAELAKLKGVPARVAFRDFTIWPRAPRPNQRP